MNYVKSGEFIQEWDEGLAKTAWYNAISCKFAHDKCRKTGNQTNRTISLVSFRFTYFLGQKNTIRSGRISRGPANPELALFSRYQKTLLIDWLGNGTKNTNMRVCRTLTSWALRRKGKGTTFSTACLFHSTQNRIFVEKQSAILRNWSSIV